MIESITLKNYKAFENVTIPIKPLTILLGANSVGKSSIIQMLMLLHQTAEERLGMYSSALKIYGNYVNVGAFENLFKDKDTSKNLQIRIQLSDEFTSDLIKRSNEDFIDKFKSADSFLPIYENDIKGYDDLSNRDIFFKYVLNLKEKIDIIYKKESNLYTFLRKRLDLPFDHNDENNIENILRCYDLTKKVSNCGKINYWITYNFSFVNSKLKIKKFSVELGDNLPLLEVENKTESNVKISSFFQLTKKDADYIHSKMHFDKTIFDIVSEVEEDDEPTPVAEYLVNMVYNFVTEIQSNLYENNLNYVSPLRAHPKRYYMLDKAKMTISLDTLDGDAIAEVLKENSSVKKNVNEWFNKFGFKIDVKPFKEIIHHMYVTQNGLPLDITDVGFGISQVLPIIIQGFLSQSGSITIVEQPEIHLHPKMQADLGDLLIDIVKEDNKKLIIETHSEYILRRIRRRISEGKLNKDDVAICLFHPKTNDNPAWVEKLEISEKGAFKWPEEYYDGELTLDVTEFLKNQN